MAEEQRIVELHDLAEMTRDLARMIGFRLTRNTTVLELCSARGAAEAAEQQYGSSVPRGAIFLSGDDCWTAKIIGPLLV